jgi:hypothetical protein
MLIEKCAEHDIPVISANTDGILVKVSNDQVNTYMRLCRDWQIETRMQLEHNPYQRYVRRDVNSYMALMEDGYVKNKGKFIEPDIKHDVKAPVIQTMARQALLFDESPREYIFRTRKDLNIYDFLFSFSATKAFDVFTYDTAIPKETQKFNTLSKTNRWYISKTSTDALNKVGGKKGNVIKIPDAQGAVLMNHITDTSLPPDLNLDYYINKAQELIDLCRGSQ